MPYKILLGKKCIKNELNRNICKSYGSKREAGFDVEKLKKQGVRGKLSIRKSAR